MQRKMSACDPEQTLNLILAPEGRPRVVVVVVAGVPLDCDPEVHHRTAAAVITAVFVIIRRSQVSVSSYSYPHVVGWMKCATSDTFNTLVRSVVSLRHAGIQTCAQS